MVLSPAIGVVLRDLGLAHLAVGRHAYDMALDPALPVVGDQAGIDYEPLLRVRPTHVLIEWGSRELPERLTRLAGERGWTLRSYPLLTLDDIRAMTMDVRYMFAGEAPAGAPDLLAAMDSAWSPQGGVFGGRVLLLGSVDPPAVMGPGSFHHQILERIGGRPAVTSGVPWINLNVEDVLRLAPDAIVFVSPRVSGTPSASSTDPAKVGPLLGRIGGLDIPAVREGRLALIDDPLSHTPSTAMIGFAAELTGVLREWAR